MRHVAAACSRLNQPSLFTSKTRSNSRRLLVRQVAADLEPGGVQQHVDASVALPHLGDGRGHGAGVASGRPRGSAPCRRPPRRPAIAASAAFSRSMRASSRLDGHRCGRSPAAFMRAASVAFRPSRSARKAARSGSSGSGSGVRSSRWKVPPEAAARSAVMADTMLPAAPVTTKTVSRSSTMPAPGTADRRRPAAGTASRRRPRRSAGRRRRPISTQPGSNRVSSISCAATAGGLDRRRRSRPPSPALRDAPR